ncbi:MAG: ribonuclease P protein component [Terriglobia bacterium]
MNGGQPSRCFPKAARILRRADFRRVYEEGRRGSARVCSIFYRSNGLPLTRLGITTPRALGKAVVRNRIRRRLREIFRLNRNAFPPGLDVVLNPRPIVATLPMGQLTREVLALFPRAPGSSSVARKP